MGIFDTIKNAIFRCGDHDDANGEGHGLTNCVQHRTAGSDSGSMALAGRHSGCIFVQ